MVVRRWPIWSGGRRGAQERAERRSAARRQRPDALRRLVGEYRVANLIEVDGRVPVRWWMKADNFGDVLSPWLITKMTGREAVVADPDQPHYLAVGSVLNLSTDQSTVWGAGSFGTENGPRFAEGATYAAVRGPLSRARIVNRGLTCPEVYGDPALLAPAYFAPRVRKTHEYGIVARWSEGRWDDVRLGRGVRLIQLGTSDVEGVIEQILSCRRIVTGSLHGLIMADAYGIPSAWITSPSAHGGAHKYFDYLASVDKLRTAQHLDTSQPLTTARLRGSLLFDDRPILFDYRALLDACPFLERTTRKHPEAVPLAASGDQAPQESAPLGLR